MESKKKNLDCQHLNWATLMVVGLVPILSSCGMSNATPVTTNSPLATSSSSPTTLTITGFSPAAGTVTTLPTSVAVTFSNDLTSSAGTASNWSYSCSGTGAGTVPGNIPTSVSYSGAVATVTLPSLTQAIGTVCTLTASSNITDTNDDLISGTVEAVYTVGTTSSNSGSYVAFFSSPASGVTLFGTESIGVDIFALDGVTTPLSTIELALGTGLGSVEISVGNFTKNPYTYSFDTTQFPNGTYILHVDGYDSTGTIKYTDIATPLKVTINNLGSTLAVACAASNGTAYLANGVPICQVPGGSCGNGMSPYQNWTTTSSNSCTGSGGCSSPDHQTTGSHSTFENVGPESIDVTNYVACGPAVSGHSACVAHVTSIGCYIP